MILHKLWSLNRKQRGFTLIEMLAALAITSLIAVGASIATSQVLNQSSRNTDYTTASRHTLNAIYWISCDVQMAQNVQPDGTSGFPLTLSWVDWDNTTHQVIYSLEDDKIRRSYSFGGGEPRETIISEYINPDSQMTNCQFDSGLLTLQVTASVGEGRQTSSVTKVREITPRPHL